MSWLQHFGMSAAPFSKELPDDRLWLPTSKAALVDDMVDACRERGSILLTGNPGVGKTCVLRALHARLPEAGFRLTYCHNATLGRRDFYRQLCLALGLAPSATAAAVFYAVSTHVADLGRDHIHPVFLLDEAHLMHQDTLDHLHILLNYQWDSRALLSVILVGLPELADRMALRRNRSLYSRLHWRLHIDPLTPADTADYIRRRLNLVDCQDELFTSDALSLIHEAATGSMRSVDRLAGNALRLAARSSGKLVERQTIMDLLDTEQRPWRDDRA